VRPMRAALVAIALIASACGSDVHDGADVDLAVVDLGSPDFAVSDCPKGTSMGAPGGGGACAQPDELCGYNESYCHCNVQSHTWYCCWDGVRQRCPAQPPSGPDCCQAYDAQCAYACTGGVATVCRCTDDRWQCTTMPCD
jgi:hypothetical protein